MSIVVKNNRGGNETETRKITTESLKKAGWQLNKNMRYVYKITDGHVHINEGNEPYREKVLFADYLFFNGKPLAVVEATRRSFARNSVQNVLEPSRQHNHLQS